MRSALKALPQPTFACILVAFLCSCLLVPTHSQNACESECVKDIYARNCGGASCITGVSSSQEFESLCGNACISAISGGGMLDCLIAIGASTMDQNNFVLNVQSFCANGDPFKPVSPSLISMTQTSPALDSTVNDSSMPSSSSVTSGMTSPSSSPSVEPSVFRLPALPPREETTASDISVDTLTSNPTAEASEPSVIEISTEASEPAIFEPPLSEEMNTDEDLDNQTAPISEVEMQTVKSRVETVENIVYNPNDQSQTALMPIEEPSSDPVSIGDPKPSTLEPPEDPPAFAPEPEVEASMPDFDKDDDTIENELLTLIEGDFDDISDDERGSGNKNEDDGN
eukprot:g4924.t1